MRGRFRVVHKDVVTVAGVACCATIAIVCIRGWLKACIAGVVIIIAKIIVIVVVIVGIDVV